MQKIVFLFDWLFAFSLLVIGVESMRIQSEMQLAATAQVQHRIVILLLLLMVDCAVKFIFFLGGGGVREAGWPGGGMRGRRRGMVCLYMNHTE